MATSTSALKKGIPPQRATTKDVITADPRPVEATPSATPSPHTAPAKTEKRRAKTLQFAISDEFFEAFGKEAAARFGFTHGAKTQLFHAMWEAYKRSNT